MTGHERPWDPSVPIRYQYLGMSLYGRGRPACFEGNYYGGELGDVKMPASIVSQHVMLALIHENERF